MKDALAERHFIKFEKERSMHSALICRKDHQKNIGYPYHFEYYGSLRASLIAAGIQVSPICFLAESSDQQTTAA